MITKLIYDTAHGNAGTPVVFCDWLPGDMVEVELPDGQIVQINAAAVSSGLDCPEETIPELARQTGIGYDTLAKAVRERRVFARKSGATWLTTVNAIEYAQARGQLRS
jgi:hypothetical protein